MKTVFTYLVNFIAVILVTTAWAETNTGYNGELTATIVAPDHVPAGQPFQIQLNGESSQSGFFVKTAWGLFQDASWVVNQGSFRFLDGIHLDGHGYHSGPSFRKTLDLVMPAGVDEIRLTFVFGDRVGFHFWQDAVAEIAVKAMNGINVTLDVKPGNCLNPVNLDAAGVVPMAIAGANDFDINSIDIDSLRVLGVPVLKTSQEDVTAPRQDGICEEVDGDLTTDLILKVSTPMLRAAIRANLGRDPQAGEVIPLTLTGNLLDQLQTEIHGEDLILVKRNSSRGQTKGKK